MVRIWYAMVRIWYADGTQWYAAGTHTVRIWYAHDTHMVRSWYADGTQTVRSRYAAGTQPVRSWYAQGTQPVRSRYAAGTQYAYRQHALVSWSINLVRMWYAWSSLLMQVYTLNTGCRARRGQVVRTEAAKIFRRIYRHPALNLIAPLHISPLDLASLARPQELLHFYFILFFV